METTQKDNGALSVRSVHRGLLEKFLNAGNQRPCGDPRLYTHPYISGINEPEGSNLEQIASQGAY